MGHNALNQPINLVHPDNTIVKYSYDKRGLLQSISQNDIIYITNISYNPKGQRENIYYGNNTKTRYDYNPLNFRLERILTTRNGGQDILQDLNYIYDPEGSIIEIRDHTQQIHYFNNQVVDPVSRYNMMLYTV